MRTKILYEDNEILIIWKPAGLATESAGIGQMDVVSELKNYLSGKNAGRVPYLGIIHRLDQPVEGLLVFAKTKKSAESLTGQLREGRLKKDYLAVVYGRALESTKRLTDNLKKEKGMAVVDETGKDPAGKKAVLSYERMATSEETSLLNVQIETGRFHQIRVQLSHAGLPILGDEKYGSGESRQLSGKMGLTSVALCAFHLQFWHPVSNEKMEFKKAPQNPVFRILYDDILQSFN